MTETAPIDEVKASIKKLNGKATALKMDLHDLAEDLPIGWEGIPDLAQKTFEAYQQLTEARAKLAELGG
jgi:hypothetical protein